MKKYVLSAVVTGLLVVPSVYAMDGGAAPAVEIEVPAVEVEVVTDDVAVDIGAIDEVKLDAVDAVVEVEVQIETVDVSDDSGIRFLGAPESIDDVEGGAVEDISVTGDDDAVRFKHFDVLEASPVDEVDPNFVDSGAESGTTFDDNGHPIQVCNLGSIADGELTLECPVAAEGEAANPVLMYSFGGRAGGDLPPNTEDQNSVDLASQSGVGVEAQDNSNEVLLRSHDNIQPNFRGGLTERGGESLAAASGAAGDSDAPNPQLLNDEQRGAVRGLRSEKESSKPRSGMGKLFSKFRKPKSEVILASATTTDKALSSKLAEIDRMRDTALRTGDQKALAKADKLEQALRAQSGKAMKIPTRTK